MKRGLVFLVSLVLILSLGLVVADNHTVEDEEAALEEIAGLEVDDAGYQCLENILDEREESEISLQEAVFGTLALGSDTKLENVISNEKDSNDGCWPSGNCNLKETAQVLLAYDRIGEDTDEIADWLLSNQDVAEDLTWYLEIDIESHSSSSCTVKYDDSEKNIDVGEDMKLSGSGGSCLSVSSSGYWLEIDEDCLNKEFEVSCDQNFITALIYQEGFDSTIYVSPETHSAASLGTTKEVVNSTCFRSGGDCDYEGTLWASLALHKVGETITSNIPYLLALAEDNSEYFPASFLYILTGADDQYSEIVQSQKQGQYWDITGSPENRFYDTSLALWALGGSGADEYDSAKEYLESIQEENGCWNNENFRDSSFVLYSGWSKSVPTSGGGSGGGSVLQCESSGFFCGIVTECVNAGGNIIDGYECSSFSDGCCSVPIAQESCSVRGGIICSASQECSGQTVPSAEGSCCLTSCQETGAANSCEVLSRGTCRSSCFSDETQLTGESCDVSGEICCQFTGEVGGDSSSSGIWIWILAILILLIVLAIIFRNKIRVWWYKRKGKVKTKKKSGGRGPPGQRPMGPRGPRPPPRPAMRQGFANQRRPAMPVRRGPRRMPRRDAELEDTLKKLKDMSK